MEEYDGSFNLRIILYHVADGLMEATLTPARAPRQLKVITLILGIAAPVVVSTGIVVRGLGNLIGTVVRLDRYICNFNLICLV